MGAAWGKSARLQVRDRKVQLGLGAAVLFLVFLVAGGHSAARDAYASGSRLLGEEAVDGPILVSYSYFEKDPIQQANFNFFLTIAMGIDNQLDQPREIDFVVVQSGDACAPCGRLLQRLSPAESIIPDVSETFVGDRVTLMRRKLNEGMDFAAHNTTLTYLIKKGQLSRYRYVFFLNSSVRGPFQAPYMPPGWRWTRAYTDRMRDNVHAVSSSLVCLPESDAGGYGPKLESWAFAVDAAGLDALLQEDLFQIRTCKLCDDGVVVKGEYGITESLNKHNMRFDTLMSRYRGVDWSDRSTWRCNDNVHPSRHGTYGGIAMHPLEVVFIKASWHVGEPFVKTYSDWMLKQAGGVPTTNGKYDEALYHYAVSERAQQDHNVEQCYKVIDDKGNAL